MSERAIHAAKLGIIDMLGAKRVNTILDRLLNLESEKDMAHMPPMFVML